MRTSLLPWLVTAVGTLFLAIAPERSPRLPPDASTEAPAELRSLRLAVSTLSSQNAALRRELDRFLGGGSNTGTTAAGTRDVPVAKADPEESAALARQVREALLRALHGDSEAEASATFFLKEILRSGPAGLAALQQAYLENPDRGARLLLMPVILSRGGDEVREFLLERIREESDPELRRTLLEQAAGFATPLHAEELKQAFLNAAGEDDEETRRAALRGLRFAGGDEVEAALLDAAADPSEEVRLAAIEALAPRPELEEDLERLLAEERSPRVRELGHCRLVLNRPTLQRSSESERRDDR